MTSVWLGLGSNLGDRETHLRQAIDKLRAPEFKIARVSPVYETAPQGYLEQDWFLNLVIAAETAWMPMRVLEHCEGVEQELKRERAIANGPRTIDIDILFYADTVIHSARLEVPHPRYRDRRFVLQPLADLESDFRDPVTRRAVEEMLAQVSDQAIRATNIVISAEP